MTKKYSMNITGEVWKFLDGNTIITQTMELGIINIRKLALYIAKVTKINASTDAIMSSLRRYPLKNHENIFENAHKIIAKSINITTKNSLVSITLDKDNEIQNQLSNIFKIINLNKGDTLRIIHSERFINIFFDKKNLETIKNLFNQKKILEINQNLAEINIHTHQEGKNVSGILAILSNRLAVNGINIIQTWSCAPENLWIVEEKDLLKAYSILLQLVQCNASKT